jgi:dolichyl-diphosphooligosaccharide--protein glycosyltransferase
LRDLVAIGLIAVAALAIRLYPAWHGVFGDARTNFLETDAWYHLRLVEHQVHNFPWRVTVDPYAAPDGQFVPIAPLYDTLTSTAVVALHGRDADLASIERTAAFVPPVLGTLAIVVLWQLARRVFGARPAVLAAVLLAVLPGHFMDRTMLGFVDHHALEALLALATLLAFVVAIDSGSAAVPTSRPRNWAARHAMPGVALGLYLLGWGSGAFLVAILAVWIVLVAMLCQSPTTLVTVSRVTGSAALVALVLVVVFQNPAMHRYGSQVISLLALAAVTVAVGAVAWRAGRAAPLDTSPDGVPRHTVLIALIVIGVAGTLVAWAIRPALVQQLATDVGRLAPDPSRMGVLEARPLFTYPGEWNWKQPWQFFRTGFYVGVAGVFMLAVRIWRHRRAADLLVGVFAVATIGATIGQNRFGYYMVPACALVGGWLAHRWLEIGDATDGSRLTAWSRAKQTAAVTAVAALLAPSLPPRLLFLPRTGMFTPYWQDALDWLREHSDPPFDAGAAGGDYYLARYRPPLLTANYTVMNWWDQGYYLIQRARRVPVSNPTQERAPNAAHFYTETDEARARHLLRAERARYVLADWELPFRFAPDGTIAGRFQTVADWAGVTHAEFYEIAYRRSNDGWTPVWLFYEPYYRSMAYRLAALGGAAAKPINATSVVTLADRTDARGFHFREIVNQQLLQTYEEALAVATAAKSPQTVIAGIDPWQAAFPIPALESLHEIYAARTPEQKPSETPWVRVFEVGR